MFFASFVKTTFSQLSSYSCKGYSEDTRQLDRLSSLIQQRVNQLKEAGGDAASDPTLIEYYETYSQIQDCLYRDNTAQLFLIPIVAIAVGLIVALRIWTIKKKKK